MLEVGYEMGNDRILLWLPWIAKHVITKDSPLSSWLTPSGFMADADACIAVVVIPAPILSPHLCCITAFTTQKMHKSRSEQRHGYLSVP